VFGPYGANGCFAGYAGSPIYETAEHRIYSQGKGAWLAQAEYGVPFLVPVLWGLGIGLAAVGTGAYVSQEMAETETARHTGGTYTMADGTSMSVDEVHSRLCAAQILTPAECAMSPSETSEFWADPPEGLAEIVTETVSGYEERKRMSGECEAKNPDGSFVDPRCAEPTGVPTWVWFAGAAVMAAAILMSPATGAATEAE
jgi:hypothetical protein